MPVRLTRTSAYEQTVRSAAPRDATIMTGPRNAFHGFTMRELGEPHIRATPGTSVRFMKHYVTDGKTKARVWYSLDNHVKHAACVTIYAKDYDRALGAVLGSSYVNRTDSGTDYFDKGHATLTPDHPLYAAARARAEQEKRR